MLFFILFFTVSSQRIEYGILYGNVENLGYYYVDIWVGTPPSKQTVIVDTGSRLTAFPCMTCTECGTHLDQYFDYSLSSTSREVTCDEDIECSGCSKDHCEYRQAYAEGSSISGILVEDVAMFGDNFELNDNVRFVFGCHKRETHLFKTQLADGIMGLGYAHSGIPSIIDLLYEDKDIYADVLAICFGILDGYMTIGGVNATHHLSEMVWADLYDDSFYAIAAHEILLNGTPLGLKPDDFTSKYTSGTMVDSGTTFVYLATRVYTKLWKAFTSFCSEDGNCVGDTVRISMEPHECYSYDSDQFASKDDFFETFPVISFMIDAISVNWYPKNYLFAWPKYPDAYCLGVYSNGNSGNVLGGLFMRGLDVVFDRRNMRIGFAVSECDPESITTNTTYIKQEWMKFLPKDEDYWYLGIMVGMVASGLLVLAIVLWMMLKRRPPPIEIELSS